MPEIFRRLRTHVAKQKIMTTINLPIFGEVTLEENSWEGVKHKYDAYIWAYQFKEYIIDLDVHFYTTRRTFHYFGGKRIG